MKLKQKIIERLNISGKISQSYQGEDIMLWRYFKLKGIRNGFFIDVGAYHPKFFNNTWRLRKKLGFTGINIEPQGIKFFKRFRRNDINLQYVIGDYSGEVSFYIANDPALSRKDKLGIILQQKTLTQIVKENNVTKIDLLDVDVEGAEMEVLNGYDWNVMPRLILIEDDKDEECKIDCFLKKQGYNEIAHTLNNALYER